MAKFTYVRQPAAGDRPEFMWGLIEHSTPVDESQKVPKSNDHVDGYDAMVIFLARTMPRCELQAPAGGSDSAPEDVGRRRILMERAREAARAADEVEAVGSAACMEVGPSESRAR